MTRFVPFLILLLSLTSCGKNSSTSDSASSPSVLAMPLNPSDKPIPDAPHENTISGLDDKLITINSETHAPMNFQSQDLTMTFDTVAQKVTGQSVISFKLKHSGKPYFELKGMVKNVKMDGVASSATSISDPNGQSQIISVSLPFIFIYQTRLNFPQSHLSTKG